MNNVLLVFNSVMLIVISIVLMVTTAQRNTLKSEAIQQGYTDHNPITGNWEWKTNVVTIVK